MAPKNNKSLANALYDLEQEEAKSQKRISDARAKRFALNINSCLALRPELADGVVDHLKSLGVDWKQIEAHQQLSLRGTSASKVEYFPRYWSARHRSWIYRRNAPPKKVLKLVPMKFMKRKVLAF